MSNSKDYLVSETVPQAAKHVLEHVLESLEKLDAKRPVLTIGLSGASMIDQLSEEVVNHLDKFKRYRDKLRFIFCDERFVKLDHNDSTYRGWKNSKFFDNLEIPQEHVYQITITDTVEQCALDYEKRLKPLLNENNGFDILLLGMGPDGHTCSLFPNHKLFLDAKNQTEIVLPISDSPKPPPQRVTLTLPVINRSQYLYFLTVGDNKAETVKKILVDKDMSLPSTNVRNPNGTLIWFLDKPAAKLL